MFHQWVLELEMFWVYVPRGEVTVQLHLLPAGPKAPSILLPKSDHRQSGYLSLCPVVPDDPTSLYSTPLPASVNASDEAVFMGDSKNPIK